MSFKDISYVEPWWPLCLVERKHLYNFGRGHIMRKFSVKLFFVWTSGSGTDISYLELYHWIYTVFSKVGIKF